MTMTVLWLIVEAVMLVIEIFTMGLTTIWFSIGACLLCNSDDADEEDR